MTQAHDVETYEQVHEYQQIPAGNEHVYQYENGQIVTISGQIPQSGTVHLKREMVIEKEPNGVDHGNSNVVVSEPHAIYVELKNESNEGLRYVHPPNGPMRYEMPERYYRYHHPQISHPMPPPSHHHHLQHVREVQGKESEGPQQTHEIQIYEPEQQSQQQQQQSGEQQNVQAEQVQEQKTHYTNLEPVHSQNYYIAEGYQPVNGNFTYLQAPTTKEGYIYPGSPVLYKSKFFFVF